LQERRDVHRCQRGASGNRSRCSGDLVVLARVRKRVACEACIGRLPAGSGGILPLAVRGRWPASSTCATRSWS
jgi:hypothetical protein